MIATSGNLGAYDLIYWNNTLQKNQDSDSDGMPNIYEMLNNLNPNLNDSILDSDSDGINNFTEFTVGTDVNNPLNNALPVLFADLYNNTPILKFNTIGTNTQEYSGMIRQYTIEYSENLKDWNTFSIHIGDGQPKILYPLTNDASFRLKVSMQFY